MQEYNLIGINMESVSTSVNYFAETGIFQTIPMIVYTINDNRTKEFHIERPIKLFYKNMSYKDFESIVKTDGTGLDFMAMPGKAYQRMQYYINRNVEKVLADMFVSIIVEILKELKEEKENIFFINNRESDKVIGRLGYMSLSSEKNTFSFVTYKPDNLMTNSMRNGSDVLEFDIEYFDKYKDKSVSEIIPNDFMESMTQTVLYRAPTREEELPPIRCDIFSQGITTSEIQRKVNLVGDIMANSHNMSMPFEYAKESGKFVRIPRVLYDSIMETSRFSQCVRANLEEESYGTNW